MFVNYIFGWFSGGQKAIPYTNIEVNTLMVFTGISLYLYRGVNIHMYRIAQNFDGGKV